jgi:anthraniloyl-CoA monooxygenase
LQQAPDIAQALAQFARTRQPVIAAYQAAAYDSMRWFEQARDFINLRPIDLAYALMMRSGRVSHEDLRRRDSGFIERYEREQRAGPSSSAS